MTPRFVVTLIVIAVVFAFAWYVGMPLVAHLRAVL